MTLAIDTRRTELDASFGERLADLERQLEALKGAVAEQSDRAQVDRLSAVVFSGSLDRLIAAFVIATGAAAMGTEVNLFFTFWGTAALRRENVVVQKTFVEKMFGWMLPGSSAKLPLSQMNMGGAGPMMIRTLMKKKGVASLEEMIHLAGELGVNVRVCTMSMDLLGLREEEMVDYPGLSYCGVAKFLETASPGKVTLFL